MKVLFKNTTKYDKESCNDFIEFHGNKYGTKELIKFIAIGACIIYLLVCNIIFKNWIFLLVMLAIGILVYLYNKENSKETKEKVQNKEFTFYFYERHIKVKYKRKFERFKYFELHKVFETDKYFYLYLDEKKSLILSKGGFSIGTVKEFSKFIKGKCLFKYHKEKE